MINRVAHLHCSGGKLMAECDWPSCMKARDQLITALGHANGTLLGIVAMIQNGGGACLGPQSIAVIEDVIKEASAAIAACR